MPVRDLADIQRIEAEPLPTRGLPRSTYEVFTASAQRWPERKALSFFLTADTYQRASTWTYAELLAEITRAANALHTFGVSTDHPVAYVLPNLPETHFTIWGGEAAGVVLAVNPLLAPDLIVEILRAAKVRVLVTLAPVPGAELWSKLAPHLSALSELRVVALAGAMTYLGGAGGTAVAAAAASVPDAKFEIVDFRAAMQNQPADRLVAPRTITEHSVSSYFCTGGTTGAREDRGAHAWQRDLRCLRRGASIRRARGAADLFLRPAAVSRQRAARHRPVAVDARSEPERLDDLGADQAVGRRLAPETANPSSVASEALRR
jgi:fatty-acyl-CoA synthase